MDDQTKSKFTSQTLVAQALGVHEPVTRAIVPPIHMAATYLRDADNGYSSGYVYGRTDNVSVQQAENVIAALEGAEEALVFGSGMAAATTVLLALDKPTHIVASQVMYWGFRSWLRDIGRYGHSVTFVETSDLDAVRAAVRPGETGLFWIETPSNPLWTVTDIAAVSEIAHSVDAILCVDFDRRHPDLHQAAVARRRYRHAFGDQISQRPFRRHCRRAGGAGRGTAVGAHSQDARPARQRARSVRSLAVDARHAHARYSRARASRNGGFAGGAVGRPSGG